MYLSQNQKNTSICADQTAISQGSNNHAGFSELLMSATTFDERRSEGGGGQGQVPSKEIYTQAALSKLEYQMLLLGIPEHEANQFSARIVRFILLDSTSLANSVNISDGIANKIFLGATSLAIFDCLPSVASLYRTTAFLVIGSAALSILGFKTLEEEIEKSRNFKQIDIFKIEVGQLYDKFNLNQKDHDSKEKLCKITEDIFRDYYKAENEIFKLFLPLRVLANISAVALCSFIPTQLVSAGALMFLAQSTISKRINSYLLESCKSKAYEIVGKR